MVDWREGLIDEWDLGAWLVIGVDVKYGDLVRE